MAMPRLLRRIGRDVLVQPDVVVVPPDQVLTLT